MFAGRTLLNLLYLTFVFLLTTSECLLKKIGSPEEHKYGNTYWGAWMLDSALDPPHPEKIWVTKHLVGDVLYGKIDSMQIVSLGIYHLISFVGLLLNTQLFIVLFVSVGLFHLVLSCLCLSQYVLSCSFSQILSSCLF